MIIEEQNNTGKVKATRLYITKKANEEITPTIPDVMKHAGVRHIVEAILTSQKPLIGYQALGDIVYMLGGMYRELPAKLTDFLQQMEELKVLIDLKTIVMNDIMKEEGVKNCSLSQIYDTVFIILFVMIVIRL